MRFICANFVWLVIATTTVSFAASNSDGQKSIPDKPTPTVMKYWGYHSGIYGSWEYQYKDVWDGFNYWCMGAGNECEKYDWCAIYNGIVIAQDPCPENNNSEYGNNLVRAAATDDGIQLPPELGLPTFSIQQQGN